MPLDSAIPLENLIEFFSDVNNFKLESYNGSTLVFTILKDETIAKGQFKTVFSEVKELPASKVEIKLSSANDEKLLMFYDESDFVNNHEKYQENFNDKCIVLLTSKNGGIIKQINETFTADKALVFNYPIYRELLSFLINKNEFTPYHDDLNHQFVIISKETGAFYIGYDILESRLHEVEDIKPSFLSLKEYFTKKEFIQFFKEVVITGTHSSKDEDRFFELVKTLKVLLNVTERDYENYILDFAFDKIKTKFKEERNKYFESLEKGIDSVSKQVVSFPLTFAATAFASYQVKDKPFILALIVLAYLLYTIIANKVLQFVNYNVACLVEDVDREEGEIKNSYNKLFSDFETDFKKIRNKIEKLQSILLYLKIILWGLLALFVFYSSYQIITFRRSPTINEQVVKIPTSNIRMTINEMTAPEKETTVKAIQPIQSDTVKTSSNKNEITSGVKNIGSTPVK
jgi:hypothetical protein